MIIRTSRSLLFASYSAIATATHPLTQYLTPLSLQAQSMPQMPTLKLKS